MDEVRNGWSKRQLDDPTMGTIDPSTPLWTNVGKSITYATSRDDFGVRCD